MDKKEIKCIHCQGEGFFNKILCPTCLGKKSLSKVEIVNILNYSREKEIVDSEVPFSEIAIRNTNDKIKIDKKERTGISIYFKEEK